MATLCTHAAEADVGGDRHTVGYLLELWPQMLEPGGRMRVGTIIDVFGTNESLARFGQPGSRFPPRGHYLLNRLDIREEQRLEFIRLNMWRKPIMSTIDLANDFLVKRCLDMHRTIQRIGKRGNICMTRKTHWQPIHVEECCDISIFFLRTLQEYRRTR